MRAHLWAAAYFLEMYPDREIYFLGRDAEQLYDVARYLVRDDLLAARRLHLINVSGSQRHDAHLGEYLKQQRLHSPLSKQFLFVDTGNADKIINAILGEFNPADQSKVVADYLSSSVGWVPSLSIFASWHDQVLKYETQKTTARRPGRIRPVARVRGYTPSRCPSENASGSV